MFARSAGRDAQEPDEGRGDREGEARPGQAAQVREVVPSRGAVSPATGRPRRSSVLLLRTFGLVVFVTGLEAGSASALSVDTSRRSAVVAFYRSTYLASEGVPLGFTGDVRRGIAGTISPRAREAARMRILYFRAMAGLDGPIRLDPGLDAKCQAAALMMSANGRISHAPPRSWRFHSRAGAEAAGKSNLALGYPDLGAAIDGLMSDRRSEAVGHRRWILDPRQQTMGIGAVPGGNDAAYVQWIMAPKAARPASPEWIAWPAAGYFPHRFVPPGWSFSYPGADLSRAKVRMTRDGDRLKVTLHPVRDGFGDNTLVWTPRGLAAEAPLEDVRLRISVENVRIGGDSRDFDYEVIVFDPDPLPGGAD